MPIYLKLIIVSFLLSFSNTCFFPSLILVSLYYSLFLHLPPLTTTYHHSNILIISDRSLTVQKQSESTCLNQKNQISLQQPMQQSPINKTTIKLHPPILKPKFTNIGYGNPRYNSMVVCEDNTVLISCGASLRKVDVKNDAVLLSKQVGYSQIFQIIENQSWIVVVNFEGLISLLHKVSLEIVKQFYCGGKQIRHSSIDQKFLVVSCELTELAEEPSKKGEGEEVDRKCVMEVYNLEEIVKSEGVLIETKPVNRKIGYYYYPEIVGGQSVVLIEYSDPNPKGRSRVETVLEKKLPIKHKILKFTINSPHSPIEEICDIKFEGEILCASKNTKTNQIYYLHSGKQLTALFLATNKIQELLLTATTAPHCVEAYKDGFLYCSKSGELSYLHFKDQNEPIVEILDVKSAGLANNYAIKESKVKKEDFFFFTENGLYYYCGSSKKTYQQSFFEITNCGVSLNQDGSKFAVADFGGSVYVFTTDETNVVPMPVGRTATGIPVRTLAWCHDSNKIAIGCVGGTLFSWDGSSAEPTFVSQLDHTINIVRYYRQYVLMGTSDGFVHILRSSTLEELYKFQAHFPIHYEDEKDREMFGSMKNYAEIWSIMAYPLEQQSQFHLITCSEDQSQKVFTVSFNEQTGEIMHEQSHHLRGHCLAVTSVDCKNLDASKNLGPLYVSCSDDKIVRFRNPENMFEVVHELETSTIKEWHTLTYLALEDNGYRVAIGSQNGYLFIFDLVSKEVVYGQKIHLGGIQGLDWVNGKLVTCSSDLCVSIMTL